MSVDISTYLNRAQGLEWLAKVHGLKIKPRYFEKLSCPSIGEGPEPDLCFAGRYLYKPETLLNWAMARAKPGRRRRDVIPPSRP